MCKEINETEKNPDQKFTGDEIAKQLDKTKTQVHFKESLEFLNNASNEIKFLKQQNTILSAKQEVFDKMHHLLTKDERYGVSDQRFNPIENQIDRFISEFKE